MLEGFGVRAYGDGRAEAGQLGLQCWGRLRRQGCGCSRDWWKTGAQHATGLASWLLREHTNQPLVHAAARAPQGVHITPCLHPRCPATSCTRPTPPMALSLHRKPLIPATHTTECVAACGACGLAPAVWSCRCLAPLPTGCPRGTATWTWW